MSLSSDAGSMISSSLSDSARLLPFSLVRICASVSSCGISRKLEVAHFRRKVLKVEVLSGRGVFAKNIEDCS